MKKLLFCMLGAFVLLSITIVCYAGDIPEALLGNDSSQVYFGEIKNVDEEGITVIQHQNIKGEFSKGSEFTHTEFIFTDSPKIGEIYLCGFIDANNPLYVWEVTSLETQNLKIKNTDDMSKRIQEYLNSGKFEEKEKERLAIIDAKNDTEPSPEEPASAITIDGAEQMDNVTTVGNNLSFPLIIGGIILIGIVFILWIKRKD
ncbi:hypothetical protein Psch_00994 [Pelotomaculum schinkii]|uniref:Uncharacterized protein n=1 Tax=Pelotomaculum schinkii TaxID=78350 RepID=A0A4Y7RF89_9FIRM|nr:hypothetical protein [Pelotomaculum schinkii]TEB07441.1 hypothetical protein Psch_00994 [Pelotomaculum schinkii]